MSVASAEETKPTFTLEQRLALGRVYGFLIELGRQRLRRLDGHKADDPAVLQEPMRDVVVETVSTQDGTMTGK